MWLPQAGLLLTSLLACAEQVKPTRAASPVELNASLVRSVVGKDQPLVVRACVRIQAPGWSWAPAFPSVEGLEAGEIRSEVLGQVSCLAVPYQGEPGAYLFPPVKVQATGPEGASLELLGPKLYGDIGEPSAGSDLGQLSAQPDRRWFKGEMSWKALWGAAAIAVLGSVAGVWLFRYFGAVPMREEPRLPPGEQALQDWARARDNPELSDQQKGQALSDITRRYLIFLGASQALQRTTDELLAELEADPRLGQWCGVLGQLLRAADTVKFAGGVASTALLSQWSEGLGGLVQAHRPPPKMEQV
ncbi:MAG: hypothetical protein ACI9VR_003393 [Cognaticolwellia sp.]|jgi:hypothetical protein